jgi:SAM-dependent methyltransferase
LLGDTPARDYSHKLTLFNQFARPELRRLISHVGLRPGMRVLDAGCGTGETLEWLLYEVQPGGAVVGVDLAEAHVQVARCRAGASIQVLQGDIQSLPLTLASFDFIWCVNTINHLRDSRAGVDKLLAVLRPGGRIAIGQSALLPEMYFAWDSRLERVAGDAVRSYYRERYHLEERDLISIRAILGLVRRAGLHDVLAQTVMIERTSPLDAATEAYLAEAIFRDTWGERLRPYIGEDDHAELARLCDPRDPRYALKRPDFHFLQTFTLVSGGLR